jgi:hypothetical protein
LKLQSYIISTKIELSAQLWGSPISSRQSTQVFKSKLSSCVRNSLTNSASRLEWEIKAMAYFYGCEEGSVMTLAGWVAAGFVL